MSDLATAIKKTIKDYMQNESLCNVYYGTFTGSGFKIDSKPMPIPLDMTVIPKHLKEEEIDGVKNVFVLKSGDRVIISQSTGGQKYAVLGVID